MKTPVILILLNVFAISMHAQDAASAIVDFEKQDSIEAAADLKTDIKKELKLIDINKELDIKKAEYFISSFDHRAKTFQWQYVASIIIFILVMVIVASGLILSYMHFYKDLKSTTPSPGTEMELSLQGLKINSSIMGLVILVISIAFLYMYLIYVFPINELTIDNTIMK